MAQQTLENQDQNLAGLKVAILSTDGVEQIELTDPKKALENAGAEVMVVSPKSGQLQGMKHDIKGDKIDVSLELSDADAADFGALVLPGGVANPDALRINPQAVAFVKGFVESGKPIAAICHGPWTLIEADAVRGQAVTSWPSLKTDLTNAGADWSDESVVVADHLVTSRKPDDLPDFNREMIKLFASSLQREMSAPSAMKNAKAKTSASPTAQI